MHGKATFAIGTNGLVWQVGSQPFGPLIPSRVTLDAGNLARAGTSLKGRHGPNHLYPGPTMDPPPSAHIGWRIEVRRPKMLTWQLAQLNALFK